MVGSPIAGLRRDLGTVESYATLVGILIGAGIFKVTTQAWLLTGPSVILGYLVLSPAILATSVAYAFFLSTPLGLELIGAGDAGAGARQTVALAGLGFFFCIHVLGIRWFGRIQVAMCAVLGLSIVVLVVPGLFAIRSENYRPFFTHGIAGFAARMRREERLDSPPGSLT